MLFCERPSEWLAVSWKGLRQIRNRTSGGTLAVPKDHALGVPVKQETLPAAFVDPGGRIACILQILQDVSRSRTRLGRTASLPI